MVARNRFLRKIFSLTVLLFLGLCMACSDSDNCDCAPSQSSNLSDTKTEIPEEVLKLSNEFLLLIEKAGGVEHFKMPDQMDYTSIPADINNPITEEKVLLGSYLFHDPATGVNVKNELNYQTFSCASCHPSANEFQPGIPQGIGEGGWGFGNSGEGRIPNPNPSIKVNDLDIYSLRVPSTLNLAFSEVMARNGGIGTRAMNEGTEQYWVGEYELNKLGFDALETQVIIAAKKRRFSVDANLIAKYGYTKLFDNAFPEKERSERYTFESACLAIAAYLRTCITDCAPFQYFLRGDKMAMTTSQLNGGILFFGKAGCINCHTGTAFANSEECIAIGLRDMDMTKGLRTMPQEGRKAFTGNENDFGKWKVPQLYNLKGVGYYGHGASMQGLRALIDYTVKGVAEDTDFPKHILSSKFIDQNLSKTELDYIDDFVRNALYDPNVKRHSPEEVPSGFCFPNADAQSQSDLFCN